LQQIIGVDIGGTKCAVTLGSEQGGDITVLDKLRFPTETNRGVQYSIDRIIENIGTILERNGKKPGDMAAIGISCGGPLDSVKGMILSPPNLIGWDQIPIVEILEGKFGIKARLQNDANACALAEWKFGAGKDCSNMIFLTFGTGMGSGLILGGRLYSGTNDMAGEVGHMRLSDHGPVGYGKAGSFEGFCSGGGIAQLARTKVLEKLQMGERVTFCESMDRLDRLDAKIVGDAAEAGDELAKEIYGICGTYLGKGLSLLIDVLNPEMIVIGSIFARSKDLLWPSAQAVIQRESLGYARNVCRVVPAELGEKIGDYAALAVAVYEER
jgi:glucokinase